MNTLDPTTTPRPPLSSLRALLPFVRPYPGLVSGWLGFLALSSSATLALPVAVRLMIDHGFAEEGGQIDRWFLGLIAVACVLAIATAGRFFCISLLGERVVADLRRQVFAHARQQRLPFGARQRRLNIDCAHKIVLPCLR